MLHTNEIQPPVETEASPDQNHLVGLTFPPREAQPDLRREIPVPNLSTPSGLAAVVESQNLTLEPEKEVHIFVLDTGYHGDQVRDVISSEIPNSDRVSGFFYELSDYVPPERANDGASLYTEGISNVVTRGSLIEDLGGTYDPQTGEITFPEGAADNPAIICLAGGAWINPLEGYSTIYEELQARVDPTITYLNVAEHREEILNYLSENRPDAYELYLVYAALQETLKERGNAVLIHAGVTGEDYLDPVSLVPPGGPILSVLSFGPANHLLRIGKGIPDWIEGTVNVPPGNPSGHSFAAAAFSGRVAEHLMAENRGRDESYSSIEPRRTLNQ